ncbi:olfactory receptor 6C75-like [Chelonoidis abingdonii]|uniref:olfactory receptor 6C75-like n=1 Tax=Chelonoidis abingdonii TaxID=106734 RepID=UPI0013F19EB2|nr:olfactory receptor 6C75-like [Chelonoidis abingdonii]
MENQTAVTEFILLGFTDIRWLQILLFVLLLITYVLTLAGNILIISITLVSQRLQTPMYFFLRNFSLLEIGFTSASIPKVLFNVASGCWYISVAGCFAQCLFYLTVGTAEFCLLAAMSFDRYMAICNPLHYTSIMTSHFCDWLVLASWLIGFGYVIVPLVLLFQLPFCGPNIVNHFFCDSAALLKLACTHTWLLRLLSFLLATGSILGTLAITVFSYFKIISMVMRIPSTAERQKAFSTCASHITVISITYGSCIFMYVTPTWSSKQDLSRAVAVLNNVVSPLLNPFIYSLRNKQVNEALTDTLSQSTVFSKNPKM